MGKKSFRLGQRIVTALASKIDGDIADDRPISGNIIVTQGSRIFTKSHIFHERADDSQFPNGDESH